MNLTTPTADPTATGVRTPPALVTTDAGKSSVTAVVTTVPSSSWIRSVTFVGPGFISRWLSVPGKTTCPMMSRSCQDFGGWAEADATRFPAEKPCRSARRRRFPGDARSLQIDGHLLDLAVELERGRVLLVHGRARVGADVERSAQAEGEALRLFEASLADLLVVDEQRQGAALAHASAVVLELPADLRRAARKLLAGHRAGDGSVEEVADEHGFAVAHVEPVAAVAAAER